MLIQIPVHSYEARCEGSSERDGKQGDERSSRILEGVVINDIVAVSTKGILGMCMLYYTSVGRLIICKKSKVFTL